MTREKMKELKKAITSEGVSFYDYIASEGYNFTKYELLDIIKELDFALYLNTDEETFKSIELDAVDELINRYSYDED